MDQQQKRPREDEAPASPKRLKHSVPVHIFYLGIYWYLDNTRCARDRIVDWLRNHTNYDDVTVDLLVPAKGEGQPKGTAWFHGYGDAPFAAARRAVVSDDESLRDVVRAVEAELTALDTAVA